MFRASCSIEGCKEKFGDRDFDTVADALVEHHTLAHGVLPEGALPVKLGINWSVEKESSKQEPQAA